MRRLLTLLPLLALADSALAAGTTAIAFQPGMVVSPSPTTPNSCQIVSGDYTITFTELGANLPASTCTSSLLYATGGLGVGVLRTGTSGILEITNNKGELFNLDAVTLNPRTSTNTLSVYGASSTAPVFTVSGTTPSLWTPTPMYGLVNLPKVTIQSTDNRFDLFSLMLTSTSSIPYQSLSGFDVPNQTGTVAHGFEIVLGGVTAADVTTSVSPVYGTPSVVDNRTLDGFPRTTIVYQSQYDFTNHKWLGGTAPGANEHFGYTVANKTPSQVSYHWLVDDGTNGWPTLIQPSTGLPSIFGELTLAPVNVELTAPALTLNANAQVSASLPAPLFDGVAQAIPHFPAGAQGLGGNQVGETFVAEVPSVVAGVYLTSDPTQNCIPPYCGTSGPGTVSPSITVTASLYAGAGTGGTLLDSRPFTFNAPFSGFVDVDYGALGIQLTPGQTYTLTLSSPLNTTPSGWVVPFVIDNGYFSYITPTGGGCSDGVYPYGKAVVNGAVQNGKACSGDAGFHVLPSKTNTAANKIYGDAVWVRVFKNDAATQRALADLVAGGQFIPNTPNQLEQDYILLQDAVGGSVNNIINALSTLTSFGSQTRNYEFYAYTGGYAAANHGAIDTTAASRGGLIGNNFAAINDTGIAPTPAPPPVQPISIQTASLPKGQVGVSYLATVLASGGTGNLTISVTGTPDLPTYGLKWDAAKGTISGIPTAAGTYSLTASATDTTGASVSSGLSLTIDPAPVVTPPPQTLSCTKPKAAKSKQAFGRVTTVGSNFVMVGALRIDYAACTHMNYGGNAKAPAAGDTLEYEGYVESNGNIMGQTLTFN